MMKRRSQHQEDPQNVDHPSAFGFFKFYLQRVVIVPNTKNFLVLGSS